TAVVLMVSLLAGSAGVVAHQALAGKPRAPQASTETSGKPLRPIAPSNETAKPQASPPKEPAEDVVAFSGRVLDPDGKPVAAAELYLTLYWGYVERPQPSPVYATTGADGRFQLTAPKTKFHKKPMVVVATTKGFGPGWVEMSAQDKNENLSVQLV